MNFLVQIDSFSLRNKKFPSLLVADFCAAAVLISFGAVLGKLTLSQLIAMATFEVIVQTVNEYIGIHYLMVLLFFFIKFNLLRKPFIY